LKNNIHAFIIIAVRAGFKLALTQWGKNIIIIEIFQEGTSS